MFDKKIAFVGAGRLGLSLALFLKNNRIKLDSIVARSDASYKRAKEILENANVVRTIDGIKKPDIIFITTRDEDIQDVASKLKDRYPESVLVHTSGAYPSTILPEGKRASLHPLQSFSDPLSAQNKIPSTFFTLEGEKEAVELCEKLLKKLNLNYEIIEADKKPLYHAAACIASNFMVTLIHNAVQTFEASGIKSNKGKKGLLNLSQGTLENIKEKGTPQALTGPIARKDFQTVRLHLDALKSYPGLLEFYKFMAEKTVEMLIKTEKDKDYERLLKIIWSI